MDKVLSTDVPYLMNQFPPGRPGDAGAGAVGGAAAAAAAAGGNPFDAFGGAAAAPPPERWAVDAAAQV